MALQLIDKLKTTVIIDTVQLVQLAGDNLKILLYRNKDIPIYKQITEQMKEQILSGDIRPSDPIPSMRSLAKQLSISVVTVQRAYDELLQEGIIDTIPAKGSFISQDCHHHLKEELERQLQKKIKETKDIASMLHLTDEKLIEKIIDQGD